MNTPIDASECVPNWHLRLYVVGGTLRSQLAFNNLQAICSQYLSDEAFRIEVIDLLSEPDTARTDNVIVTPTTVRLRPAPQIQLIGDLTDKERASRILGFTANGKIE